MELVDWCSSTMLRCVKSHLGRYGRAHLLFWRPRHPAQPCCWRQGVTRAAENPAEADSGAISDSDRYRTRPRGTAPRCPGIGVCSERRVPRSTRQLGQDIRSWHSQYPASTSSHRTAVPFRASTSAVTATPISTRSPRNRSPWSMTMWCRRIRHSRASRCSTRRTSKFYAGRRVRSSAAIRRPEW